MVFSIAPLFLIHDRSHTDLLVIVCQRSHPTVLEKKPIGLLVRLEALQGDGRIGVQHLGFAMRQKSGA